MTLSEAKQRIVDAFGDEDLSASEVGRRVGIAKSTALGHLRVLGGAGIVQVLGTGSGAKWRLMRNDVQRRSDERVDEIFGAGPAAPATDRIALIRELLEIEEELERVEPLVERAKHRRAEIMEALR